MNSLIRFFLIIALSMISIDALAESKDVTMQVGETKTLYLPSSVTSKVLKAVNFYSNGISYVQVTTYDNYSVTVKAIKAFSSPIIVRCDYYYFVRSGNYTYQAKGFYDFNITVVGDNKVKPTRITFPSSVAAVKVGESRQLEPTVYPADAEYTLTWSINDHSVASISQDGLLTGLSEGAADLTVKADNGVYAMLRVVVSGTSPSSVSVRPASIELTEGDYEYISATVYPSDADQSVKWLTDNPKVATVSQYGRVVAVGAGRCKITARTTNGLTAACSVKVLPETIIPTAVAISPESAEIEIEETLQLQASVSPAEASTFLVWSSSDVAVATVDNGMVTGVAAGSCEICVSTDNGLSAVCELTVKPKDEPAYEPASDWSGTYTMKAKVECAESVHFCYPDEFLLNISRGEDNSFYVTSFIGLEAVNGGIRLKFTSDYEATADLSSGNILGKNHDGDTSESMFLLSSNDTYDSEQPGSITLMLGENSELTVSDFYVYYSESELAENMIREAHYTACQSSDKESQSADAILPDSDAEDIAVYTFDGRLIYLGIEMNLPALESGVYIVHKGPKVFKIIK